MDLVSLLNFTGCLSRHLVHSSGTVAARSVIRLMANSFSPPAVCSRLQIGPSWSVYSVCWLHRLRCRSLSRLRCTGEIFPPSAAHVEGSHLPREIESAHPLLIYSLGVDLPLQYAVSVDTHILVVLHQIDILYWNAWKPTNIIKKPSSEFTFLPF